MRLARPRPPGALGCADEVWGSRLAPPEQHRWIAAGGITRLQELERPKEDADPKALAC